MLSHSRKCPVLQVDELTPGGEANNAGQAGASAAHKQSLLLLELLTRVSTFLRVVSGRRCLRHACPLAAAPPPPPLWLRSVAACLLCNCVGIACHRCTRENASTLQSCHGR